MISLVIPCFNCAGSISRCLDSIERLGFSADTEIVVVNDGSTDRSLEILNNYKGRLQTVIINQENAGVSAARNRGVLAAKGDAIVFLDSDDILLDSYDQGLQVALKRPDTLICFDSSYMTTKRCSIHSSNPDWLKWLPLNQRVRYINFITTSGTCVPRRSFIEVGGFRDELAVCEDWDLWVRLSMVCQIDYIGVLAVGYCADNCGLSSRRWTMVKEELGILVRYSGISKDVLGYALTAASIIRLVSRSFLLAAMGFVKKRLNRSS